MKRVMKVKRKMKKMKSISLYRRFIFMRSRMDIPKKMCIQNRNLNLKIDSGFN